MTSIIEMPEGSEPTTCNVWNPRDGDVIVFRPKDRMTNHEMRALAEELGRAINEIGNKTAKSIQFMLIPWELDIVEIRKDTNR